MPDSIDFWALLEECFRLPQCATLNGVSVSVIPSVLRNTEYCYHTQFNTEYCVRSTAYSICIITCGAEPFRARLKIRRLALPLRLQKVTFHLSAFHTHPSLSLNHHQHQPTHQTISNSPFDDIVSLVSDSEAHLPASPRICNVRNHADLRQDP